MGSDQSAGEDSVRLARQIADIAEAERRAHQGSRHGESGHGDQSHTRTGTMALALGALGVVYGDIGTSPLYSLKEAFTEKAHRMNVDMTNVYGVCSLAFWALVIVISVKYLLFVMRADNHGEGGILALTALVMPKKGKTVAKAGILVALGVFGTSLLYGDGIITPAISVLSAVEGLEVVQPGLQSWVVPIAIAIIVGLFLVQKRGTGGIGKVFGPIMILWFATIALLGLSHIGDAPGIIKSINPTYAFQYFTHEPLKAFLSLGSIFLVVTGGEALYADMGHFGRRPIAIGWYAMVLPSLLLNYWGQGAYIMTEVVPITGEGASEIQHHMLENVFFNMAPDSLLLPVVILATCATVIASQALISGVFSLTAQAVKLDYLPRIAIRHTSQQHSGQIYIPLVNWVLMVACVGLVLGFQTASNLAAAYGIAVTMTMAITTLIFYRVLTDQWHWRPWRAMLICAPLLVVESGFLGANIIKIPKGGWFALLVGIALMVQMQTWRRGRALVAERIRRGERELEEVLDETEDVKRVPGTAVFMFKDLGKAPPALVNNLRHNKVLHKTTLIVSVETADSPRVDPAKRTSITKIAPGVFEVLIEFGFMEEPAVPPVLESIHQLGLEYDPNDVTFFIGHESIVAGKAPGMNPLAEYLFVMLNRGADSAVRFFDLPTDRVFEVGTRVEI